MRRLRRADGKWLESERDKVDGLVRDLFGEETAQVSGVVGKGEGCPYSEDEVMEWVRGALSGTKNNSAAGPDEVGYRLIKAVRDTKLGIEVLGEVVAALRGGYIPDRWREMRVVLIPKPGRDVSGARDCLSLAYVS